MFVLFYLKGKISYLSITIFFKLSFFQLMFQVDQNVQDKPIPDTRP